MLRPGDRSAISQRAGSTGTLPSPATPTRTPDAIVAESLLADRLTIAAFPSSRAARKEATWPPSPLAAVETPRSLVQALTTATVRLNHGREAAVPEAASGATTEASSNVPAATEETASLLSAGGQRSPPGGTATALSGDASSVSRAGLLDTPAAIVRHLGLSPLRLQRGAALELAALAGPLLVGLGQEPRTSGSRSGRRRRAGWHTPRARVPPPPTVLGTGMSYIELLACGGVPGDPLAPEENSLTGGKGTRETDDELDMDDTRWGFYSEGDEGAGMEDDEVDADGQSSKPMSDQSTKSEGREPSMVCRATFTEH